jgi:hypothetical protein
MPRAGFSQYFSVYTKPGSTSNDRGFFPGTGAMRSAGIKSVLAAIEMYASQGDVFIEPAFQESDDGQVWSPWATFTPIGGTPINLSADNVAYDSAYQTVTINKAFVRFGVAVRNTSGSSIKHALAAIRVEVRAC